MKSPRKTKKARKGFDEAAFVGKAATTAPDKAPASSRSKKPAPGRVRATFDLPADLHAALKVMAAQEGRSMRDVAVELLSKYTNRKRG